LPKFAVKKLAIDEFAFEQIAREIAIVKSAIFKRTAGNSDTPRKCAISKLHICKVLIIPIIVKRGAYSNAVECWGALCEHYFRC
jgi:hypothetical protein